jgi:hypothetical protein
MNNAPLTLWLVTAVSLYSSVNMSGCRGGNRTALFRAYEAREIPFLYSAIIFTILIQELLNLVRGRILFLQYPLRC